MHQSLIISHVHIGFYAVVLTFFYVVVTLQLQVRTAQLHL